MGVRRLVLSGLVSLCALVGGLLFASVPAFAAIEHPLLGEFGGSETPAGKLGSASGVAVDAATGDVYVADIASNVVDKFDASGKYLCQITGSSLPSLSECNGVGGSKTPGGSFSFTEPAAVAVDNATDPSDPSKGDVYVLDGGHSVIDKFNSAGGYVGQISKGVEDAAFSELEGVGVDQDGVVWVYQGTHEIDSFNNAVTTEFLSSRISQAPGVSQSGFAVGADDNLYPAHRIVKKIAQLNSAGEVQSEELGGEEGAVAVATDSSTGEVYADYGSHVSEYDPAGNPLAQFGSGQLGSGGSGGDAVDPVTGAVYVANAVDGKVDVYGPTPGPRVAPRAASGVQTTSATLNATVNPEGAATMYQFEYGTSASYGQSAPVSPASAGTGSTPVPVSVGIGELEGGTTYHYRVVATDAGGHTTRGADLTFRTLPVPVIGGGAVTTLTAGSATLNAQIDPEGVQLSDCHFDYGTSTSYGLTMACTPSPGTIPADSSDHAVSASVTGLSANTPYHWRVVASDANGSTMGSDHTFVYDTSGGGLPDNRAYEMVTPPQKNGALLGDVSIFNSPPSIAEDGSRVIAASIQCFGGATSCIADHANRIGSSYAFERTSAGWVTTALAPSATQFPLNSSLSFTANTGEALFSMPTGPDGEDDYYVREQGGSFVNIGPITPPSGGQASPSLATATEDYSHVFWELRPAAWPFDETIVGSQEGGNVETERSVYEYVGTGNPRPFLVGVSGGLGSTDLISACATHLGNGPEQVPHGPTGVSTDGRIVFFIAYACLRGSGANDKTEVPANELYARIDGETSEAHTVAISARSPRDCTGSCQSSAPSNANFLAGSSNGSKVFFTSSQRLTDDASEGQENLYLYDLDGPEGHNLVDVSAGDTSGGGPRLQGVSAISSDGSHAYFVAQSVLTTSPNRQGQTAQNNANNLYVFERECPGGEVTCARPASRTAFVATLSPSGYESGQWTEFGENADAANVTPNGRFFAFISSARLTPDDISMRRGFQVFRYGASTGELLRISIGDDGFNDNGNSATSSYFCSPGFGCIDD